MKLESIVQPGANLPRSAQRLQHALVETVSYLEGQRALKPAVVPTQAVSLRAFLAAAIVYLDANTGTTAP